MLKYPCLVLDHDDTVVQSEKTVNFPYFQYILNEFRPGTTVTLQEYTQGCFHLGFVEMCRQWYGFSDAELSEEYRGWQSYVREHIPAPYPGIAEVIRRYKAAGGTVCVVSQSCRENITRDYLEHIGLLPDAIYGWDLPEAQRKPSPFALLDIMQRFGFRPEQLLVVDDMKPATEMAASVHAPVAFAGWGREDCPELAVEMKKICDFSFCTPQELEQFLFDDLTGMV